MGASKPHFCNILGFRVPTRVLKVVFDHAPSICIVTRPVYYGGNSLPFHSILHRYREKATGSNFVFDYFVKENLLLF